ncbi:lysylphosphatidylglycerol synthase transmembrane domain-containing protein [Rosistilla oblonga]|uniref:lysylphosphatidylglycerol synthase transmembrane domain-containing protein n=1 Tax=Rosistilla oblonga TaxID=2527990 RepID=UPI003A983465
MNTTPSTTRSPKTVLLTVAKFGVPVGIVWYLVSQIQPQQWSALQNSPKQYSLLVMALLIGLSATLLSYVRWWLLVRSHNIPLTPTEGIRLAAIGFLLNFVSIGAVGGDLFKAYFLARRTPGKKIEVFATALVDRVVGLYGLLVVASVALWMIGDSLAGDDVTMIRAVVYTLTLAGAAFMLGVVLGGSLIDQALDRILNVPMIGPFVHRIADPLRAFRHHTAAFMVTIGMSVVVHILLGVAIYFIAAGLYEHPPTLAEHMVIVPIANAVAGLPISLAGIGVFEGALDHLYAKLPTTPTDASGTIVGLVYEIVKIAIAMIGIVFYWTGQREVRESFQAVAASDDET